MVVRIEMNKSAPRLSIVMTLACLAGLVATGFARAETSKTIANYRLHMFDGPFRSLANRTIQLMFDTARVENGPDRSVLPEAKAKLDFTYQFNGVQHPAEDVLEDTDTDGLLIIKDGKIVYERY